MYTFISDNYLLPLCLPFGIMLVSVIGTAIFWYLAHGKEGEGSYRMCEDKRIQIGNRMKYMPMGYFNSHSLGNLTSVSTATMSDLESMSFAIIVRTLVGVIHASIFLLPCATLAGRLV